MTKISNEIREWCDLCGGIIDSGDKAELRDLADRIDRETVELPKSADGKIWTSYEVCFWVDDGEKFRYHRFDNLVRKDGKWYVEDTDGVRYEAKFAWHVFPDSWERIADELDEFRKDFANSCKICANGEDALHDLAERIRKLAEKEKK